MRINYVRFLLKTPLIKDLTENYLPTDSFNNEVYDDEEGILFEVPNNVTFSLSPDLFTEMKTQNVMENFTCNEEQTSVSLLISDTNILNLPINEVVANNELGTLFVNNRDDATPLEEVLLVKETELQNIEQR